VAGLAYVAAVADQGGIDLGEVLRDILRIHSAEALRSPAEGGILVVVADPVAGFAVEEEGRDLTGPRDFGEVGRHSGEADLAALDLGL